MSVAVFPYDAERPFCTLCLTCRVEFPTSYFCPLCSEPRPPKPFPSLPTPLCPWPAETWVSP